MKTIAKLEIDRTDISQFENIKRVTKKGYYDDILSQMDVGNSIFIENAKFDEPIFSAARHYGYKNKLKFSVVSEENGKRLWRIV